MDRKGIIGALSLGLALIVGVSAGRGAQATAAPVRAGANPAHSMQTMPEALRPALYQALANDAGATYAVNKAGCATLTREKIKACFDADGAHFKGATPLALRLTAWGRGSDLATVMPVRPTIKGNQVTYRRGAVTEWWRVLPMGYEQGFTIAKRPSGRGELTFALAMSRRPGAGRDPVEKGASISGRDAHSHRIPASADMTDKRNANIIVWGQLRYGKLAVTDANGRDVSATLKAEGNRILVAVNDAHAAYPLTVDPLVWLEQEVTATDGAFQDQFGNAVAISGSTAIVGASNATVNGNDQQGAVYVFRDENGVWTQTAKLTASDGQAGDFFGHAVALDGNTALVGVWSPFVGRVDGGAYVFTESNGTWTQVAKLLPDDQPAADSWFGYTVALAGHTMALVGAPSAVSNDGTQTGLVYVFSSTDGTWTQTQKFDGNETVYADYFGNAVAVSGTTALIGEFHADDEGSFRGDAYVFTASPSGTWTEAQRLTASDAEDGDYFGSAVALDGTTALIGATGASVNDVKDSGAVYVFKKSGGAWTQAQKLHGQQGPPDQESAIEFGYSVALDGSTAVIGAPDDSVGNDNGEQGGAYVFTESNGTWTQAFRFFAFNPAFEDKFGIDVAVGGNTACIGADGKRVNDNAGQGAVYCFGRVNDLDLAVSAPANAPQNSNYVSQTIATNYASATSPAITATMAVLAAASYVSATATQGSCSEHNGVVTCDFGPIAGDGGTATANVTLKATGEVGTTIENTASVVDAVPPLTASAPTRITGGNHPPVAQDGTLKTTENVARGGTLQASDPDGDPLTFSIVSNPKHGTVNLDDASKGTYTYTPDQDYTGSDSFTFKANDGRADSNVATISITVEAANRPPVAEDGALTTDENTAKGGTLVATDPDGDTLTFSIVANSAHGTVTLDDASTGAYTYTPNDDYTGADSFTFKANDGVADSNVATISITVKKVTPPPPPPPTPPAPPLCHGGGCGGFGWLALAGLLGLIFVGRYIRKRQRGSGIRAAFKRRCGKLAAVLWCVIPMTSLAASPGIWTGPYLGGRAGVNYGSSDSFDSEQALTAGVEGGYDFQLSEHFVVGGDAFYEWNQNKDHGWCSGKTCETVSIGSNVYGVEALFGFPVGDTGRLMPYVKIGYAWVNFTGDANQCDNGPRYGAGLAFFVGSGDALSLDVQYTYLKLGSDSDNWTNGNLTVGASFRF